MIGDVKAWLNKPASNTVIQTTPFTPLNVNSSGQQLTKTPDVYVNVNPVLTERTTATLTPSTSNSTPSVVISDPTPVFNMKYNGNKFDYVPYTQEQYNFDPKTWKFDFNRTTTMNLNVEVPTPKWGLGVGKSFGGKVAIQGDYRIGNTPFNVWGYASDKDQALGIKFVQYGSRSSK